MQRASEVLTLSLIFVLLCGPVAPAADEKPVAAKPKPTVVLDTTGFWRMHQVLKPPVIESDGAARPVLLKETHLNVETPEPPAKWAQVGFDDGSWVRGPARRASLTPYLARLCLRGKFMVTDPEAIKGLALTVGYHGGVVVRVNGTEVARAHLPSGVVTAKTLAESYPEEAFIDAKGKTLSRPKGGWSEQADAETARRLGLRERLLADVAIPAKLLRKGVNVVAIEIVRAPYHRVVEKLKDTGNRLCPYSLNWYTCEIRRVQLTASRTAGLVPNATRPPGLQVWNSQLLASDFCLDFGDPAEPLQAIDIIGVRNGAFSAKVVVGSTKPILGLKATVSDLNGGAGSIPAAAVAVRYGVRWGEEFLYNWPNAPESPYPAQPGYLGALEESPPEEIPIPELRGRPLAEGRPLATPGQPDPVPGAVASIWVTVEVPKKTRAGTYEGELRISAQNEKPVTVALKLEVIDWTLAAPGEWRTWVELVQSPDTLAMEYNVPYWSEKHWELIAKSMSFLGRVGCRMVTIPLISRTHYGHGESMVRWIPKADGRFDYDFSVMERYLDLAEKQIGRPTIVCFYAWDVYLIPEDGDGSRPWQSPLARGHEARHSNLAEYLSGKGLLGKGPAVTVLDRTAERTETIQLPKLQEARSKDLWKPLFDQLRGRMGKRGLEKAMMLGTMSDGQPSKEQCVFFNEVSGKLPWVSHSHTGFQSTDGRYQLYGTADIGYHTQMDDLWVADTAAQGRYGWQRSDLKANSFSMPADTRPATFWLRISECTLASGLRGTGRLGADLWAAVKDDRGYRRGGVRQLYPQSGWRNMDPGDFALLAPGRQGAIATIHYEMFRLGLQECEARIFIEQALTDSRLKARLGPGLVKRCWKAINERDIAMRKGMENLQLPGRYVRTMMWYPGVSGHAWFMGSGRQERTEKLYKLAAEVARKVR